MGNCLTFLHRRNEDRSIILLMIGLDNAGKTQTINNLVGDPDLQVLPTVGFKAVNLVHRKTPVTIYDLGGSSEFREIWPQYYSEVFGVIFVIDSSDYNRLPECKKVLKEVISHDQIAGKPILILANKQDKRGAMDDFDIVERLNIEPLVNKYRCPTLVESYTATLTPVKGKRRMDPGLKKGYHWLLNYIIRRYGDFNLRVKTDVYCDLKRRMKKQEQHKEIQLVNTENPLSNQSMECQNSTKERDTFEDEYSYYVDKAVGTSGSESAENMIIHFCANSAGSVILVKPPTRQMESASSEEMSRTESLPKLQMSPIFGKSSTQELSTRIVELEPKDKLSKLPVTSAKRRIISSNDLKQQRPHTTPISNCWIESEFENVLDERNTIPVQSSRPLKGPLTLDSLLTLSDGEFRKLSSKRPASAIMRPASASQAICRQLEFERHSQKGRFSFKSAQHSRMSPQHASLFHYEPLPPIENLPTSGSKIVEISRKKCASYISYNNGDF